MNRHEIKAAVASIERCGRAVWECQENKRMVRAVNRWQPERYGRHNFKPQCLKCGRIGTAKGQIPPCLNSAPVVTPDEAKTFEAKLQEKRTALYHELSAAFDQEIADRDAQWQRKYEAYLHSFRWQKKRNRVLARDKHICQSCLEKVATQVHHLSYKHLGDEPLFELVSICPECHIKLHPKDT